METICAIKDIYKTLYQFEKSFADKNIQSDHLCREQGIYPP